MLGFRITVDDDGAETGFVADVVIVYEFQFFLFIRRVKVDSKSLVIFQPSLVHFIDEGLFHVLAGFGIIKIELLEAAIFHFPLDENRAATIVQVTLGKVGNWG